MTFVDFDICQRMSSLQKLHPVTLTYFLKVKKFHFFISYTVRAGAKMHGIRDVPEWKCSSPARPDLWQRLPPQGGADPEPQRIGADRSGPNNKLMMRK